MTTKPILFNAEMIKAILAGRKTETRRLIKAGNHKVLGGQTYFNGIDEMYAAETQSGGVVVAPFQKGDVLWVRETWNFLPCITCDAGNICETIPANMETADGITNGCYLYKADSDNPVFRGGQNWRPSIHMPRHAARIFLRVTEVSAARLQESILEAKRPPMAEFYNEGVADDADHTNCSNCKVLFGAPECRGKDSKCVPIQKTSEKFARLWDSTVPKDKLEELGWAADPWVWVIRFERCEAPGS